MTFFELASFFQTKIIYLVAYFPVVTFIGYSQAFINHKMGDDTAKNMGFLSLDPTVHFDPFGFFFLMFPWQLLDAGDSIGFGQFIPYSLDGIYGRFKFLKKMVISFSAFISALISSIIWLLILALYLGILGINTINPVTIAIAQIFKGIISLSVRLSMLYFVINIVDCAIYHFDKKGVIRENFMLRFLIIILAAIFILPIIQLLLFKIIGF